MKDWKIDEALDLPLAVIEDTEDGEGIVEIGERTPRNLEVARLIAAAPELLAACKEAFFQFEHNGEESDSDKEVLDRLQAAIAKATEGTI